MILTLCDCNLHRFGAARFAALNRSGTPTLIIEDSHITNNKIIDSCYDARWNLNHQRTVGIYLGDSYFSSSNINLSARQRKIDTIDCDKVFYSNRGRIYFANTGLQPQTAYTTGFAWNWAARWTRFIPWFTARIFGLTSLTITTGRVTARITFVIVVLRMRHVIGFYCGKIIYFCKNLTSRNSPKFDPGQELLQLSHLS